MEDGRIAFKARTRHFYALPAKALTQEGCFIIRNPLKTHNES